MNFSSAYASTLPKGFVYLKDIDPTIIQSIRYYSDKNFVGKIIDGYKAPKVVLTIEAAIALKAVQDEIKKDGYSLVIYDAYRPQKAVQHFLRWSKDNIDQKNKESFYPYIDKSKCFKLGYIVERSSHSRGSTVDLSIIKLGQKVNNDFKLIKRKLKDNSTISYLDDNTVDMYTSFDLFDEASHHDSKLIDEQYLVKRNYLRSKMQKYNFKDYPTEWWHYTLNDEPYKNQYFDFDIE
ncbi:MAG: M15 family metallopeptidase [Rickettsia endosymbiont of Argas persicus]